MGCVMSGRGLRTVTYLGWIVLNVEYYLLKSSCPACSGVVHRVDKRSGGSRKD